MCAVGDELAIAANMEASNVAYATESAVDKVDYATAFEARKKVAGTFTLSLFTVNFVLDSVLNSVCCVGDAAAAADAVAAADAAAIAKICRAASLARDALIASGGITYERTGGQYVRVRDAAAAKDAAAADAVAAAADDATGEATIKSSFISYRSTRTSLHSDRKRSVTITHNKFEFPIWDRLGLRG